MVEREAFQMTVDEFRAQVGDDHEGIVELINGEMVITTPKRLHQLMMLSIALLIKTLVKRGELNAAPVNVYLDEQNYVEPDILWVAPDSTQCRIGEDDFYYGAPDLIIEILSPSSIKRDRFEKYQLYEKHGVREYWIVEPEARLIEVFALQNGAFIRTGIYDDKGELASPVLGMTFKMSELLKGDS